VRIPRHSDDPVALGLDGCRSGWIAAIAYGSVEQPTRTALKRFDGIDEVLAWRESQGSEPIVAVDVPMGLPDHVGLRPCDAEARARLGRRWMCVFEPPDRALYGNDFESARGDRLGATVCFLELAQEALPRKKGSAGKKRRLALLQHEFDDIGEQLVAVPWLRNEVAYDDLLDAYISLWSALRFTRGHHVELGAGETDT
jgi:predicted RNase H-like nuclease